MRTGGVEEADGATAVAGALKDVHAEGALEQRRPVERVLRGTVPPPAENGRSGVSDGAPARAGAAPASSRGFGLATLTAAPARARPGTRASSTRAVARRLERQGETTFGRSDTGAAGDAFRSSRTVSTDDNSSAQVARATFTNAAILGEHGELGNVSLLIVWRYAFWTSIRDMKEAALHVDLTTFGPETSFDALMRPLIEARVEEWPDLELEEAP